MTNDAAGGPAWNVEYRKPGKNSPPMAILRVELAFPAPLTLSREGSMDLVGKKIGLSSELQTGDAAFDAAVYVDSAYPEYASRLLAAAEDRDLVRALFGRWGNLRRLECSDKVRAVFSPAKPGDMDPAAVSQAVAALARLASAASGSIVTRRPIFERLEGILIGASAVLATAGLGAFIAGLIGYPPRQAGPFLLGAGLGLLFEVLFAGGAWLLLKGRSGAFKALVLALGIGLGGGVLGGMGTIIIANGALDRSLPALHRAVVLDKYESHGKNGTNRYVVYKELVGGDEGRLSVRADFYASVEAGSRIRFVTRAGALGFEWRGDFWKE
jgi:hypothetical protein